MKIHLRNQTTFNPTTLKFYKEHFEIVSEKDADLIVINDFEPIETDKIVACNSTGLDHIEAKEIISLRGEDLSDLTAVAELTLAMAIYCMRVFKREEIKGKSWLILGFGRIGKQLLKYLREFKVFPYLIDKDNIDQLGEYLKILDIISLHITANERNRNFIDKKKFETMRDEVIFLNSARPWLVEKKALKWALDNKLAGAWFDFDMPFSHPKLITTSHLGGTTKESRAKSEMIIAKKLLKYVQS